MRNEVEKFSRETGLIVTIWLLNGRLGRGCFDRLHFFCRSFFRFFFLLLGVSQISRDVGRFELRLHEYGRYGVQLVSI